MSNTSNSDIALAIIDFLKKSVANGDVAEDFGESIDVAIDCIADAYGVDKENASATVSSKFGGKSLGELIKSAGSASAVPVNIPEEDVELKAKANALKLEGNKAIARKDYDEAVLKYTEALKLVPTDAVFLSNRAAAYSAKREHELAAADAELAIKSDPTYAKAYSRLGLLKFALGDSKAAMEAYKLGLEAEGDSPSESMKKGYETAKSRVQSELESSLEKTESATRDAGSDASTGAGASAGAGAGGLPDLSKLAGMFGGGAGGAGGMADLFNNPQIMQAAQQMMSDPNAMLNLMSNPAIKQMAAQMGLGGGSGAGSGEGSSSGLPDLSDLMNNPMLANMANQFLGGNKK